MSSVDCQQLIDFLDFLIINNVEDIFDDENNNYIRITKDVIQSLLLRSLDEEYLDLLGYVHIKDFHLITFIDKNRSLSLNEITGQKGPTELLMARQITLILHDDLTYAKIIDSNLELESESEYGEEDITNMKNKVTTININDSGKEVNVSEKREVLKRHFIPVVYSIPSEIEFQKLTMRFK